MSRGDELALELLERGQLLTFRARGASMTPFVRDGDVLTLARPDVLGKGDLALVSRAGALRLHRVLAIDGAGRVLLRGDALRAPDGWFSPTEIAGRVLSVRRGARSLPRWRWEGLHLLSLAVLSRWVRRWRARLRRGPVSGQLPA